jgi:hypothetical protein
MTVTLATAINEILDGMLESIEAATASGGALQGVALVARADRAEPRPDTPAVYIAPKALTLSSGDNRTLNATETWVLPIEITGVVMEKCPIDGYSEATDLTARARAVLLTHTSSNFGLDYVRQVASNKFDPAGPWSRAGDYYRATAEVEVLFRIRG